MKSKYKFLPSCFTLVDIKRGEDADLKWYFRFEQGDLILEKIQPSTGQSHIVEINNVTIEPCFPIDRRT
jgi:hypothetical protein